MSISFAVGFAVIGISTYIIADSVYHKYRRQPQYGHVHYHDFLVCHHPEELRTKFGDLVCLEAYHQHRSICRCPPGRCPIPD